MYQKRNRQGGGGKLIEINEGETIIIYPHQRVTVRALEPKNVLMFVVLEGASVADYFDLFGFCNGMHGRTSCQQAIFNDVRNRIAQGEGNADDGVIMRLTDVLTTFARDFRENGDPLVFDAIRQIRLNLKNQIVRLEPLCKQLGVSRAYLHRVFVRSGFGSPSEFIRSEQLQAILRLLRETRLSLTEIAAKTGFISTSHFSNFVRRYTGKTARSYSRKQGVYE